MVLDATLGSYYYTPPLECYFIGHTEAEVICRSVPLGEARGTGTERYMHGVSWNVFDDALRGGCLVMRGVGWRLLCRHLP